MFYLLFIIFFHLDLHILLKPIHTFVCFLKDLSRFIFLRLHQDSKKKGSHEVCSSLEGMGKAGF